MKLPKRLDTLDVLGKQYRLVENTTKLNTDSESGACDPTLCLIEWSTKQDPQQLRDTLLHEVMHACYSEMGLHEEVPDILEETVIRRLATALLYVLRANQEFTKFLVRSP